MNHLKRLAEQFRDFTLERGEPCYYGYLLDPIIFFTDGSSIKFATEETEVGEYGTAIAYRKSKKEGT